MPVRYASARFIAGLTQFLGWVVILLGLFGALALQRELGMPGLFLAIAGTTLAGLILIAFGQIMLAVLDTAENTGDTAANTQKALAVLERIATAAAATAANTETMARRPQAASPAPEPAPEPARSAKPTADGGLVVHKGYRIYTDSRGNVSCDGRYFASVDEARGWIDSTTKG